MFRLFTASAAIRACGAVAQVLMTLVISRACGVESAGIVFFGYSLIMIASTLARAGTELSALRDIAQAHAARDQGALQSRGLARLILVCALGGLICAVVVLSASMVAERSLGPNAAAALRWAGVAIPAFALTGLLSEFFKGIQRAWVGLTVQNLATPALVVVTLLVAPTHRASQASAVIAAASWLTAIAALVFWRRLTGRWSILTLRQAGGGAGRLIRDVPTLLVVTVAPVVMQWIGAALLGFLAAPAEVAGYSVAARLAIAVSVVHSAASSISAPRMAVAHSSGDIYGLHRVVMQTGLLISIITWPILIILAVAAPVVLDFFGPGYGGFSVALRVLLVGQVVASLIGHSGIVLVMVGRYAAARRVSLIAIVSLTVLMAILAPLFGAIGAAIATSASVIFGHLAGLTIVRRDVGIWTIPTSSSSLRVAVGSHFGGIPRGALTRSRLASGVSEDTLDAS